MKKIAKFFAWVLLIVFGASFITKLVNTNKADSVECDHVYGEEILLGEATCEKAGAALKICSACGDQKIVVKESAHDWVTCGGEPATCGAEGVQNWECNICWETKSEILPKLSEHTGLFIDYTVQPTGWVDGYNEWCCSGCYTFFEREVLPALHHDNDGDLFCDECGVRKEETVEDGSSLREGWYRFYDKSGSYYLLDQDGQSIEICSKDGSYDIYGPGGYTLNGEFEIEVGDGYIDVLFEFKTIEYNAGGPPQDYEVILSEAAMWDCSGVYFLGQY